MKITIEVPNGEYCTGCSVLRPEDRSIEATCLAFLWGLVGKAENGIVTWLKCDYCLKGGVSE